jgi:hypothetical protein
MKKLFFLSTAMLLLFPVTLCMAQITKKQAISIVMTSIVGDQGDSVNVYMESDVQTTQFYLLSPYDSIPAKFSTYWLFFIDLKPLYGWEHACEYVFINSDNGDTATVAKQVPPYKPETPLSDVSVPFQFTTNPPDFDIQNTHLPYPSGNSSLYAIMFTGGDPLGNGAYSPVFWYALSHMYCGLREHGFLKSHIKVLSYSGQQTSHNDHSNPSLDLDNDSSPDILPVPCTKRNIDSIFSLFTNTMTSGDMLYVFVTTHGIYYPSDTSTFYFKLYGKDSISNYQFAEDIEPIHCAQKIFNLWSCQSGGFTYRLSLMNDHSKKTILTATDKNHLVVRDPVFNANTGIDTYNYFSCSALRGWHPDMLNPNARAPWAVTYRVGNMPQSIFDSFVKAPPNAVDTNFDSIPYGGNYNGIQEINEVMNYTKAYDQSFDSLGSKIYNCGFHKGNASQPPEDLLSLFGITGKVQYTQTVEGNFLIGGKLSVEPGKTLTLDTNATFYVFDSAIVVKTGAQRNDSAGKLVMRGAKMTSSEDTALWQGIEVWGQDSIPDVYPYQALVLMDSSTIENARIGISTSHKNGGVVVPHTEGGIIFARTSTFNNNKIALEFLPYSYPNLGQMRYNTFKTTGSLLDGSDPSKFVYIQGASGVGLLFNGCTFKNWTSTTTPDYHKGIGIYSIDGSFGTDQYTYCKGKNVPSPCPNPITVPSRFEGLYYGIKAVNSNTSKLADIVNTSFTNNHHAVYLANMNYPNIIKDTFNIPAATSSDTCYGIYLNHCSFYTVQEDSLKSNYQPGGSQSYKTVGMVINHSGEDINEIYNNHFSNIMYGAIAENLNRNKVDTTGLCIKCNDFFSTKYDVVVNQQGTNSDWGIARNQGWKQFRTDPAGNTFSISHDDSTNMLADIDNEDAIFNYFFHDPGSTTFRVEPKYSNTNFVTRKNTGKPYDSKNAACPSKLSGGSGSGSEDQLKAQLVVQQQSVDSISSTLSALTDGGNTATLNSTIANSDPSESYQVRQQLLGYSPYLSDTVLKTAVQKENVLPNEMIRDILVANPQAPKSEGVMDQLNNRSNPMPDSMLAQIQSGISLLGAKDSLGAVLHNHLQAKHDVFNKLVTLYKQDTVNPSASHDSLITLFSVDHTLSSKYQLAFEYLSRKDTVGVHTTLNSIPSMFSLDNEETALHQAYLTYFSVMNTLVAQGKLITGLSQSQIAPMQSLMENGPDPVQSLARNILIANNLYGYTEPIILPDETKSAKQKTPIKAGKINTLSFMNLFPNPSNQYIIVEYDLKDKLSAGQTGELTITTIQGQKAINTSITKQVDQVLISTSTLPVGTYLITLKAFGKVIETKRFIIVR